MLYLLFIAPGLLLSIIASLYVRSTFNRYREVGTSRGRTGAQVAAELLHRAGVAGVTIEPVEGSLSDHYDPSARALRLSPDVFHGTSISAAGVAAHEAGHAIQHHAGYSLMGVRQTLVGPARLGSSLSYFIIAAGMVVNLTAVAWLGVALFAAVFLFELVTVPVEINASARARRALTDLGLVTADEARGVGKVLNAAALTYIAAMVTSLLTLLYYVLQLTGRRRD